ncbi:MAG: MFS transporter [Candidatus Micrarchaeia archaeon]
MSSDKIGKKSDGKKSVILLSITSFINDVSSEMILPILPFFLASFGITPVFIGLVGGVRDSLSSLLKVFSGYLSDRIGKRMPFIYTGYFISSVFKVLLAFSPTWLFAIIFSSLERIGKGVRDAPRDALIGSLMPERTGEGFGIQRSLDTAGAFIGTILIILLFYYFGFELFSIILLAGFIGLLSLIPLLFVREEKYDKVTRGMFFSIKNIPKEAKMLILVASVFTLANFSYMFFIMKAQVETGSLIYPVLLYLLYNLFYALSAYPLGTFADIIGKKKTLALGYFMFSFVMFGMIYAHDIFSLTVLFVLYGISVGIVETIHKAYVYDLSSKDTKGVSAGVFQASIGIMALPASIIAGGLWEISPGYAFTLAGIFSLCALIFLAFINRKQ